MVPCGVTSWDAGCSDAVRRGLQGSGVPWFGVVSSMWCDQVHDVGKVLDTNKNRYQFLASPTRVTIHMCVFSICVTIDGVDIKL